MGIGGKRKDTERDHGPGQRIISKRATAINKFARLEYLQWQRASLVFGKRALLWSGEQEIGRAHV